VADTELGHPRTVALVKGVDHGDFRQGNLYTVRPDGTRLRQLTHFASSVRVLQTGSYSPDVASIIFATTAGATRGLGLLPDVFVMRADGTDIRPVTRSRNWDGSPDWGRDPNMEPSMEPSGRNGLGLRSKNARDAVAFFVGS
jgi:hypothetical protein